MKSARGPAGKFLAKASTGIAGFDEITGAGLLRGCTTLRAGRPGSGKTIPGLQFLVHGAQCARAQEAAISGAGPVSDWL